MDKNKFIDFINELKIIYLRTEGFLMLDHILGKILNGEFDKEE